MHGCYIADITFIPEKDGNLVYQCKFSYHNENLDTVQLAYDTLDRYQVNKHGGKKFKPVLYKVVLHNVERSL